MEKSDIAALVSTQGAFKGISVVLMVVDRVSGATKQTTRLVI